VIDQSPGELLRERKNRFRKGRPSHPQSRWNNTSFSSQVPVEEKHQHSSQQIFFLVFQQGKYTTTLWQAVHTFDRAGDCDGHFFGYTIRKQRKRPAKKKKKK
jgi:hypothetical protein